MVHFMLDDLRRPVRKGFLPCLHGAGLPLYFDFPIPRRFPNAVQRKAAFLRFIGLLRADDHRVEHFAAV